MHENSEAHAREAVARLLDGQAQKELDTDQYGCFGEAINEMVRASGDDGQEGARRVFETYARHDPRIAALRAADDDDDDERSPLPMELTPDLELGWIDWYTDVMSELTGSPPEFNRLIGKTVVATAIRRLARLPMSYGNVFPNIYGVIIAPSSVYHKSTALSKARDLMVRAQFEELLLSELQTSEGLLSELEEQPDGLIVRDEIGTLFASNRTKYLQQLKPDLTALYDCMPYSRSLSKEKVKLAKPYLNILGATTPQRFADGVRHSDWVDGFLPRWLMVMPDCEPRFDVDATNMSPEMEREIDELAKQVRQAVDHEETDFILTDDALDLWNEWQKQATIDAYRNGDDITSAVVSRYNTYGLKFAMILATVNGSWGKIDLDIMDTAIQLADNYKVYVGRILAERLNLGVSGAKLQRIHEVVRKMDTGSGVTRKLILQHTRIRASELTPCLEKLLEIGALMEIPAKRGQRYVAVGDSLPVKTWK